MTSYLDKEHNSKMSSFQPEENDAIRPTITGDSKQSGMDLPQLDKNLSQTKYVDGLAYAFMDQ